PKATWQDGVPVTAKDVIFTTNLINNPAFPATSTLGFDHIKTITATGTEQVNIVLKQPYAPFLQDYASSYILPQHVLGQIPVAQIRTDDQYNRRPLGSGPFEASDFVAGDHVTLTANKAYFLGAPHLAQVVWRFVPSGTTAVNQMRTGEANLAGQTADLSANQYNELKHAPGLIGYNTPGFNWSHIDLIETGFLKDVAVRQALQMATPRDKLIKLVALGYGVPQYSDQSPAKPFYDKAVESYWPYDTTKASAALAADGFTKGSNGTLQKGGVPFNVTLSVDAADSSQTEAGQVVKQAWGQIGVNVTIKPLAPATIFGDGGPLYDPNRLASSTMNAVLYEWIESSDPDDHYFWESSQIISKTIKAGGNFDGYTNPAADKLMVQGLLTADTTQRKAIYDKLQIILANDVPDIWLYWGDVLTVSTSKLHNYLPNPFNYRTAWNAKDWYLQ
ncbi:MAG: peptide ABC transporter substrate-binding protein, partial [Chloroflexota bacterium]